MLITRFETLPMTIPLRHPYRIAYQNITEARLLFIRISTACGIDGFGCAAPEEAITGESFESAQACLDGPARELLTGSDPLRRVHTMERLNRICPDVPSARAAVDIALVDILGRKAGLPVWQLFGGYRRGIETSITLGIAPLEETLRDAKELARQGFRILKLKGGLDVEEDAEKLNCLRSLLGPELILRFDANQGYTVGEAMELLERAREAEIEILEQPTPRGRPRLLGHLSKGQSVPVMADESMQSLHEAFHLARNELVDMVNIKLMKVGGFNAARRIDAVAQAAGIETMVGCMDEPGLGIAASLHFSLSQENVGYADLDGFLDLFDDPTRDAIILKRGILYPRSEPGFGFTPQFF